MKLNLTNVLLGVIVLLVAYAIFFSSHVLGASSTTGATFNSAKVAAVVMSPTSATATSSSILNTDSSDRIITDNFVSCAGATTTAFAQTAAGLANWTWTAGTTTTSAPANLPSEPLAMNINVATGTYDAYTASSTYTQVAARRWAAGSYLTFTVNGTTTPSISCVAGVHYVGS